MQLQNTRAPGIDQIDRYTLMAIAVRAGDAWLPSTFDPIYLRLLCHTPERTCELSVLQGATRDVLEAAVCKAAQIPDKQLIELWCRFSDTRIERFVQSPWGLGTGHGLHAGCQLVCAYMKAVPGRGLVIERAPKQVGRFSSRSPPITVLPQLADVLAEIMRHGTTTEPQLGSTAHVPSVLFICIYFFCYGLTTPHSRRAVILPTSI